MKSSIFVLCFIATSGIVNGYSYEVHKSPACSDNLYLSLIITQLNDLKQGIERCDSRIEKNYKDTDTILKKSSIFDIRVDTLPEKCKTDNLPKNCAEATACTHRSGIYKILLEKYNILPFLVECDVKTEGGDWTLIQRRQDGSVDFYRDWSEYRNGFGNIDGEFFIGLEKLHALTNYNGPQELLVILEAKNETAKAFYSNFAVGGEIDSYDLKHLGVYSGNAGDSLRPHLGAKFTTKDRNNGEYKIDNCATMYTGAWWYKSCHSSNLNGKFGDDAYGKGLSWFTFRGHNESVRGVTMMIRRRSF